MFTGYWAKSKITNLFTAKLAWLWFLLATIISLPTASHASEPFTPAELDTLVSTIALYPDPLLVQVLAASVHGDEIPGASDWANQHKNLKGNELAERIKLEDLPYDESVQALIPFPTVLATMAKYQVWTDQLGDAVASQKEAVMDAVQRMRNAAYNHGHLQTNEQVKVIKEKTIIIEPVQKEYVYVPVYNPHVVYYVHSNGYPGLRYRTGVWIGGYYGTWGWGTSRFEWDTHLIYVNDYRWYHNRPRPHHPPRYGNPPPPRSNKPQPRSDRYAVPPRHDSYAPQPSKPVKVPMNHNTVPQSRVEQRPISGHSYAPAQRPTSARRTSTTNSNDNSQDEYYEQNRNSSYDRNNSSNRHSSSGRSSFGKSLRK